MIRARYVGAAAPCSQASSEDNIMLPKQIPDTLIEKIGNARMSHIETRANVLDLEKRILRHKISTISADSYGTVFLPEGCDFERFDKNPMALWLHGRGNSIPKLPIGVSVASRFCAAIRPTTRIIFGFINAI